MALNLFIATTTATTITLPEPNPANATNTTATTAENLPITSLSNKPVTSTRAIKSITDEMNSTIDDAQPSIAATSSYIYFTASDISSNMLSHIVTNSESEAQVTNQNDLNPTTFSYINASSISSIMLSIPIVTTSEPETTQNGSDPTTITVVALAVIIGLLILLMLMGCALFLCFICYRRHKSMSFELPLNQYSLPTELILHEKRSSLPTFANGCYSKNSSRMTLELPEPPTVYSVPEIYSEVGIDGDSGLYDDIGENHYALIPETNSKAINDTKKDANTTISHDKSMPYETPRLSKCEQTFDEIQKQPSETINPVPQIPTNETQTAPVLVGIYSEVGESVQDIQEGAYYTDMQGSGRAASQLSICSKCSSCNSIPLLQLSKPLSHDMEDNPTYNSAWSLLGENEGQEAGEDTYTDPDASLSNHDSGSQLKIYETVYSDSQVKSAIFNRNDAAKISSSDITDTIEQSSTKEGSDSEEVEEKKAMLMYCPIYLSCDVAPSTSQKQPLAVTNDNICGIKVLGTGFFGKVVLADTVGLSLKDLGLSETDDDKSTSIQVAVKKLKLNASTSTREAFEKECRFMSRLDHPNVIRMLGVCTTEPSQFIMMEYMEKGDLSGYLEEYKTIIQGQEAPKEEEIHVSTLVHMCTQIAAAMEYLVSRNFIHRDLAARNCLVGDKNVIKLADFGMSRNLYESHYYLVQGSAVLPVRWMASECFYGKFSAKTDVWAFGVTIWEIFMLAKERPYSDMEDMEVVNDAIEKEERTLLQQPDHCPDAVYQIMMKCWAKEPKDRATFKELHVMLMQLNN